MICSELSVDTSHSDTGVQAEQYMRCLHGIWEQHRH